MTVLLSLKFEPKVVFFIFDSEVAISFYISKMVTSISQLLIEGYCKKQFHQTSTSAVSMNFESSRLNRSVSMYFFADCSFPICKLFKTMN